MSSNIDDFIKEVSDRVEPVIKEVLVLNLDPAREEMVLYQINSGGKRLRPAIAAASCFLFGGKWSDIIYPAAGLEILHNYTLIIDDIIDRSQLRRGKETTWKKYGQSLAQCAGMHYAASLMQAGGMSKKSEKISKELASALKIVIEGEVKDILADAQPKETSEYLKQALFSEVNLDTYQRIVAEKTAALFIIAARSGALVADATQDQENLIADYALNLGMAFQISDDLLDIFGEEEIFGKETGKDIREGKRSNVVVIYALDGMKTNEKQRFIDILRYDNKTEDMINEAIEMIKATMARDETISLGQNFIKQAHASLEKLPKNEWNDLLRDIASGIMLRIR